MEYIGIDLHQRYSTLCVIDDQGALLEQTRIPTTRKALATWFLRRSECRIAIEACGSSPWVYRQLSDLGREVFVVNPRRVRLIAESTLKTDKVDAETLARLVRIDPRFLAPIRPRSRTAQLGRARLRIRRSILQSRTRMINTARGLCRAFGYPLPRCTAEVFADRLYERDDLPNDLQHLLLPLAEQIECLTWSLRHEDGELRKLAQEEELLKRLSAIPGVGPLVALAFVLCIDDPHRFRRSRDVGPYLGLRPRLYESADISRTGHITKQGDSYVRTLLVQGAHALMRSKQDTDLKRFALRLEGRVGKHKAIVAVARKLAILMHHLWVSGETYQPLRRADQAAA